MKKIIYKLIDNKKITLFFVLIIIVSGVFSYVSSPKQESPDFSIPYAMITTVFPGASQGDVDTYVTAPIEKAIMEIDGFESSVAYSSNSLSLVIVELTYATDKDKAFNEIKEAMRSIQGNLPKECLTIDVNTHITDTAGVLISMSSDELSNMEIVDYAGKTGDALLKIDGIKNYEVIGGLNKVVSIEVNEVAMKQTGLTLAEISEIVASGNLDIPIGKIIEADNKLVVNYNGTYERVDDIENLVVGYLQELQRIIYLKDIADITEKTATSNTYYRHNGKSAVVLAAYFDEGINIVPIKDEINEKLDDMEKVFPKGLETSVIISQPEEVDESLKAFSLNLVFAVVLVILVILIGMGFKNALVVSVSLPLSILISFTAMNLLGIKIHQVSIAALIVCLGMLVDNSIVVSDSIQGYIDEGIKKRKACMLGVKDVAGPVFASTITTIAAFVPFLFLNSIAGDYIKSLPQIVSISLAASYFTAMLVIPVLAFILFKKHKKGADRNRGRLFKKLLKGSLKRKWVVIFILIIVIAGSVFLALDLEMEFFPASSKDVVYIDIRNNSSDNLEGTMQIVTEIEVIINKEDVVSEFTSAAGGGLPRFNQILFVYNKTPDIGQIMMRVDLEGSDYKTNEEYKVYLQDKIDAMDLDAKITVKELMYAFPMDEDLKIRITGKDPDILKIYESSVYEVLIAKPGIINVSKGNTDYIDEYNMEISADKIAPYGVMVPNVQNELSIAILGRESAVMRKDEGEIPVVVKGEAGSNNDIGSLPIRTASGEYINASAIIELSKVNALSTIPRYNGKYAMTITADYDTEYDKAALLSEIKDGLDDMKLENVTFIYEGEDELIKENFGQVGILGIVALAVVFLILMVQFKSLSLPLLIFVTIPLSAVGSVLGLYITGQSLSFTALLGIVSLLGIVVNNAIILIDYIKREQSKGVKIDKACINASARRLRPILLSTITTVIGLVPLVIGTSQLFRPMAIALMSGLLVSTLLTLIVLPVFVSAIYKKR